MNYFGIIQSVEQTADVAQISMITDLDALHKIRRYGQQQEVTAELRIYDGRTITPDQRKKIYATIKDMANYVGDVPEFLKEYLKYDYCTKAGEEYFSLSDCSVTTAREFINYLLEFCIQWDIPLSDQGTERTDDIDKYVYLCLKYRRCAITGAKGADIHHCIGSQVGMGSNRSKIDNRGRKLIALSRAWHTKVHQEGEEEIFAAHHIYGIEVDEDTLKELGLSVKEID